MSFEVYLVNSYQFDTQQDQSLHLFLLVTGGVSLILALLLAFFFFFFFVIKSWEILPPPVLNALICSANIQCL